MTTRNDDPDQTTVVIAIDGSQQAAYAFEYYLANIHKSSMKVILLHAAEHEWHPASSAEPKVGTSAEFWDHVLERDDEKIKDLEDHYTGILENLKIDFKFVLVLATKPGEVICSHALTNQAALIVVGSRGHNRIRRTILGSVSEYVLHHAHCPVMICRQEGGGICNVCGPQ